MTLNLRLTAADLAPRGTLHDVRIVTRHYPDYREWSAGLYDAAPDSATGWGPTEAAAIADLHAQLAAVHLMRCPPEPRWWIITKTIAIAVLTPVLVIGLIWCVWGLCVAAGLTQ